ncbi:hypothetical protein [Salinibacterium sp. ZJ70]|uniref:hypothetical protein n=1 Tax=Salinibacterium sp. ZJ70 TaxID=2708084 RepID=UPI0014229FAF|nr:hypothetical protein [Salinibacterium sp. ZJ70]
MKLDWANETSARAVIDETVGEISTPLSEYDIYDSHFNLETINLTILLRSGECMEAQGLIAPPVDLGSRDLPIDDRDFGQWFEPNAREFGAGFPSSSYDAELTALAESEGETWLSAYYACGEEALSDPELAEFVPSNEEINDSLLSSTRTTARERAQQDPTWQSARESYWTCLEEAGLTPRRGANEWGVEEVAPAGYDDRGVPEWSAESIKASYSVVTCNTESGLTRTLGDLVASYEAPLIKENQAAFNELKSKKQHRLELAETYINTHG